ncbi:group I intron-associated PD-(D/E)XK endonuclease [Micromonospora parathelypteridis]|uniref:PD(D/E)XK endonuclease domain-containing protein n=1 Tax=Micromonospora parathelypteridis TaxID=1839617 RepID=A0A840VH99_9ACTN|nr:group I intron-associated PD-(D/E)XK endonuclease [Micromonospora parathelypteridis]MBB5476203.1 hypothetical protein [Micromonospora parathelypteridis]GGO13944.1 hypothetical protein GCM10011576_24430 [Micromonospora parathelypteridis]
MGSQRTYTDEQVRDAVKSASCWADVMEALGKSRTYPQTFVKRTATELGLDVSHLGRQNSSVPVPPQAHHFSRPPAPDGRSGLSIAARWFLDRGYNVSVPLEPAVYDLIAESDDGLKRVQVKTTAAVERRSGRYRVRLLRSSYQAAAELNSRGRVRQVPYTNDEVDYFFVATAAGTTYLLPFAVVRNVRSSIVLDEKYAAFVV